MNQADCAGILLVDLKKLKPKMFTQLELDLIGERLTWAFAVGFNEGVSSRQPQSPVVQLNKFGEYINTHSSITQAGRSLRLFPQNIHRVITGKVHSTGGFQFMRESDYKKLKHI